MIEPVRDNWVIALGDLVSLQELNVPVRVSFAPGGIAGSLGSAVRLSFSAGGPPVEPVSADVTWTIVTGPEVGAQARNRRVDRAVADAYASLGRREAGRLNRDGDYAGARLELDRVARRIQHYAGDDAELNDLVRSLQHDAVEHEARLSALNLKVRYMASERSLKGRDAHGGSRRRPNRPGRPA